MSFLDFRRGATGVRLLLEFGREQGLDADVLLHGSGVEDGLLSDPNAELSPIQELRVVKNLSRLMGHPPGLGLRLGLRYRLGNFGVWGYALMSSATLGDALDLAIRFLPLTFAYSGVGYRTPHDHVQLYFVAPNLPPGLRRLLVERDMATAAMLLQQLGGDRFRLSRFALKWVPGRPGVRVRHDIVGTPLEFDAKEYVLEFERVHLGHRLSQADPATAVMCERMCKQLQERRRADIGTAAMVRHHLSSLPPGVRPELGHVAHLLSTSERTLKRRLQDEGTSFRELVTRTQADLALKLVQDPLLSVTHIADRMGYADLSAFSQAFKRWYGISPEHHRRQSAHPA